MKAIQDLRWLREESKKIIRAPKFSEEEDPIFIIPVLCGIGCAALGAIIMCVFKEPQYASLGMVSGFILYLIYPLLAWVFSFAWHLKMPPPRFFKRFFFWHNGFCIFFFAWLAVYGINHNYNRVVGYWREYQDIKSTHSTSKDYYSKGHTAGEIAENKSIKNIDKIEDAESRAERIDYIKHHPLPIQSTWSWGIAWLLMSIFITYCIKRLQVYQQRREYRLEANSSAASVKKESPFKLWIGRSTGMLSEVAHGASIGAMQNISLSLEDAAQNIIVLGGIGSGKTTRAINPLLLQLMDQECGGLIFDIKGNFFESVMSFSEKTGRNIVTLGPDYEKINLLSDLTPEIASSFLKSIFLLNSKGSNDSFWIDTATELCRNTLGILSFFEEKYTLRGLYSYLFDEEYRKDIDYQIKSLLPMLDENQKTLMAAYARYHTSIFEKFDEKVQANVNATVAQVLSPFTHPTLMEAFCTSSPVTSEKAQIKLSSTLDGDIYLVSLPLSVWGLAGKVVYSFIKLSFYNVMQKRNLQKNWNQSRPVFFMCDEFQEIVSASRDGLSDLNFWDKSRSSKTIGIISAQAVSSFYAAIGDRDVSHALLQNFRQKLCFRTEDTVTLNYFNSLADKVEVRRETKSYTSGSTSSIHGGSSSSSQTKTITLVDKPVLSPQLFRGLDPNHAIALLSINGHSMDDVLMMKQVFVE